jgi:hypothetical protein
MKMLNVVKSVKSALRSAYSVQDKQAAIKNALSGVSRDDAEAALLTIYRDDNTNDTDYDAVCNCLAYVRGFRGNVAELIEGEVDDVDYEAA